MTEHSLKDEAARQVIAGELDINLLVEAGAGSGKTSSLVKRMTALIKEGGRRVETIAAITFTRKAAAELKGRFQLALEEACAQETDREKGARLEQALSNLERCFIGTVHSFCASLLRERPVEAGIDPSFTELDELEDGLLKRKAWDDYLLQTEVKNPELIEKLGRIGCDPGDLYHFFETLLTYPDVEFVRQELPLPDFSRARGQLDRFLHWARSMMPEQAPPQGWDGLQNLIKKGWSLSRILDLNDPLNLLYLLSELDRSASVVQRRWPDPQAAKDAQAGFAQFKEHYLQPALKEWREYRYAVLTDFVQPALIYYAELKEMGSKLNFEDLLLRTASLLRDNPEARSYFQKRYTQILVDEFQDTDPIQAEVIFYLTGTDLFEKNWRRLVPRPGSLFVVGDPKQSIYRFRRADIAIYNEVKRLLEAGGGRVLTLTANFRSQRAVGDWINSVFRPLFPAQSTPYQAAFAPLNTVRPSDDRRASGVRLISIPKAARNKKSEIEKVDAQKISSFIYRSLNGGLKLYRTPEEEKAGLTESPRPGDFLVLFRYKEAMELYAGALEEKGIPLQITGGGGFSSCREMKDLLNLLRALLNPGDTVHLAAVLRGGLFGISDQAIWEFKEAGGCFHIYEQIPSGLEEGTALLFSEVYARLRLYRQWLQQLPVSAAAMKIISDTGLIPSALAGEQGKAKAGYLVQAVELLASAERRGITAFTELLSYLEQLMGAGVEEEIDLDGGDRDAVRLMNLHKAKGLESPVVILANPAKNSSFAPSVHISRCGGSPRGYFLVEKKGQYTSEILGQPAGWEQFSKEEEEYLHAEEKRLLYVAATRAKNLLVVSVYPEKPELSPWYLFNDRLTDVPVLDDQENGGMISREKRCSSLVAGDLDEARGKFLKASSELNAPSYQAAAVTSLVRSGGSYPKRGGEGRGMSWGRVIHRVLEACAKNSRIKLDIFIENVLAEEGRLPLEKGDALEYVRGILRSPFWERVLRSKKRFVEIPFAQRTTAAAFAEKDTIVSGVIDLIFQDEGGWVVVDYKTDAVESEDELKALAEYYSPQLDLYRSFWEEITGERVVQAGFYFTSASKWVCRNFD